MAETTPRLEIRGVTRAFGGELIFDPIGLPQGKLRAARTDFQH